VLVFASVRLYRDGLADALRRAGMDVVGVVGTWADALVSLRAVAADVALLDVAGPGGLEIVRELRLGVPETRIVVLAIDEVERDVLAWAEAGVSGYVTRDGSVDDLVLAVVSAARREAHCAPRISGALLEHVHVLSVSGPPSAPIGSLTRREREIAELIETELSNKQIAAHLHIELATVKNHVHSILAKLEVSRRADAAAQMRRARRAVL
jgi:two-component system nitrate/nitrite response regulator NarL